MPFLLCEGAVCNPLIRELDARLRVEGRDGQAAADMAAYVKVAHVTKHEPAGDPVYRCTECGTLRRWGGNSDDYYVVALLNEQRRIAMDFGRPR